MKVLTLVFLCLCLVVNSWSQVPLHCTTPPFLTGSVSLSGPNGDYSSVIKYEYDAIGKKIRVKGFGMKEGRPFLLDYLMLFQQGIMYDINWTTYQCKKKALDTTFQPMAVPSNAMFLNQVVVGTSSMLGNGLLVNNWIGEFPEKNAKYMTTFTEIACLPLTTIYHTNETGNMAASFYNTLIGISDPQVFVPPSHCKGVPVEGMTDFFGAFFTN